MAKLNVVKTEICSLTCKTEATHLFACENLRDHLQVADQCSINISDLVLHRPTDKSICTLSYLEDLCEFSDLKLEKICAGKGLIKSFADDFFCLFTNSLEKMHLVYLKNFKSKLVTKTISMDGYALSLFLYCLNHSKKYIEVVTNNLSRQCYNLGKLPNKGIKIGYSELKVNLKEPERHVMDLTWAKMACAKMEELRQLQYTMSWLSTLGGAFSALGEEQERCAKAAGRISVEQLRIAMKLGDDIIIAQCKLYFSLSLIQRGYCSLAKKIIQEQYNKMKNGPIVDRKTLNMCKGIWARLKYEKFLKKLSKQKLVDT